MTPKITYLFGWLGKSAEEQEQAMHEFIEAGEKYVVLTSSLLEEGCRKTETLVDLHTRLRKAGLEFADAHAPWGTWSDPGHPLEEYRKILLDRQKMALRFCAMFGVTTMTYHTGNTFNSIFGQHLKLEDYYNALIRSLEELLPLAEECNVIMALENQWTPLNHSSILLKVLDHFKSPFLGLCYDSGHGNLTEKGSADPENSIVPPLWKDLGVPVQWEENLIEKFQPYMVTCHLTDNHGLLDEHILPGCGNIDWKRIMQVLDNAPKLQCIQNECGKPSDMSIGDFCRNFRKGIGK